MTDEGVTGEQLVELRAHDGLCVVTLRREHKLNALSTALEGALAGALDDARVQSSSCVIFTGGDRVFSAGADIGELRDRDPASILAYYGATGAVYERVAALRQPTIAAIAGYCLGGGLELALACDFRVADATAVFGLPEVGMGILPSSGGTQRLVRLVGTARAKELLLLSMRFGVDEARALGLVTKAVAAGGALSHALELAERVAALPPLAVAVAKQAIDVMPDASHGAGLALERLAYGLLAQTADAHEAADAFAQKRPPRFRGG
jgi:enoyl-CoA hydratase/carnithine racemase